MTTSSNSCAVRISAPTTWALRKVLDLAERWHHRRDIGFLFVGRGSDAQRLRGDAKARGLDNVIFHDEIEP